MKPYSAACERNKDPILAVLRRFFADVSLVLEIGSGTGQHAVHMGTHLPHLTWQTSDLAVHHDGIRRWLEDAGLPNVGSPLPLDVDQTEWPELEPDAVFTANTFHIVSWPQVQRLLAGAARALKAAAPEKRGKLAVYGPFNYGGSYTGPGNRNFDQMLRQRDPLSGIRDFEAVVAQARSEGFVLVEDVAMPADNHLLTFVRD